MTTMLLILISALSVPPEVASAFEEANNAFKDGRYADAEEGYSKVNAALYGNSPALLFNLANARYMQGRLGGAILYYEAALALDPDFEAARQNLQAALGETRRNLPLPDPRQISSSLLARHYPLSPRQSLFLVHVGLVVALLLLLARQWRTGTRHVWAGRVALGLALLFYGFALAGNGALRSAPKLAVAQIQEIPVYFSMNESDQPRFLLYEGDRVLVDRIENDWVRLYAHGGERGWTRKDNLGIVDYRIW